MGIIADIKSGKDIVLTKDFYLHSELGTFSTIFGYFNPPKHVAVKIPRKTSEKRYDSERIIEGANFQKEIFDKGFPVPEPYGMFKGKPVYNFSDMAFEYSPDLDFVNCFGMEFIEGHNYYRRYDEDSYYAMKEARNIAKSIEEKMKLRPKKEYLLCERNVMWDAINKRIVLVDFEDWERC